MKKIKRIALLVVAVLVLLVAASGVKTVLDMKNSADNEVQEEDSTRWAEPTSDPLNIEGIADASAKYASAAVNGSLNLVFNGIWSRQTDYFTVPGGSLTITIEEPDAGTLFLRFAYATGFAANPNSEDRAYVDYVKSAYQQSDLDCVRIIRSLTAQGSLQ
jgi:hypothetical protein